MNRILLAVALYCSIAARVTFASDNPPSEASIKQLLGAAQAHKVLDQISGQIDAMMKNFMQQATQGRPVSPDVQKAFDKCRADLATLMREELNWERLEPIYIRVYQKSFTQQEVDGMTAFYKTPAGQAVINKLPLVLQNTMAEMQPLMAPMMQRIERMQHDVVAQLQAEQAKKGG